MSFKNSKKLNINLMALTLAIFLAFVYFVGSSFAWFTDDNKLIETDEVAQIEMQLLNGSNQPLIEAPSFVYNGAEIKPLEIKVKNIQNSNESSINAIVRVMIVAVWSNGLPAYISEMGDDRVTYTLYDDSKWAKTSEIGFDYLYYNGVLAPGGVINFLTDITFPTLPSSYNNQTVTFIISVEGLQANGAGVSLWENQSPVDWDPFAV